MTIKNLDAVFAPKSVALIGATNRERAVGNIVARNLFRQGFGGPIMLVNPKAPAIGGVIAYKDVASLPVVPDLAILSIPPAAIPGVIKQLGERGTRGAVVITAGLRDIKDDAGVSQQDKMLAAAKPFDLRILGPNCLGTVSTHIGLNGCFAEAAPRKGNIAFVAQSGAMVATLCDWAEERKIGFSYLASMGDQSDIDFADMLEYLADDEHTEAVILYVEAISNAGGFNPRRFMEAAQKCCAQKPVVALKAGRSAIAAKAAASHTGALAGVDGVYDAAFERAGIIRAQHLDELLDSIETFSKGLKVKGDNLAIVTNGGGAGVMAVDALSDYGGALIDVPQDAMDKLNACLPDVWSHANPIDIIGDSTPERYYQSLTALDGVAGIDGVCVLHCPTATAVSIDKAKAVVEARKALGLPMIANWLGGNDETRAVRMLFDDNGIPNFPTPEQCIRSFMHLARFNATQKRLAGTEVHDIPGHKPDFAKGKKLIDEAMAEKLTWLDAPRLAALFEAYQIPGAKCAVAKTPDEVAKLSEKFGAPIVIKIMSPDITHKSDVGGVALNLKEPASAKKAAEEMLKTVGKNCPKAKLEGFLVQEMISRPGAYELIVGVASDIAFGPFMLFGKGGVSVEVEADKALALAPLTKDIAETMIKRTRIYKLLKGFRDRKAVPLDAVVDTLLKVSKLICDFPEIAELDINPLLADPTGVVGVDARIKLVKPADGPRDARFAVKP
jgi:acetyltransferase